MDSHLCIRIQPAIALLLICSSCGGKSPTSTNHMRPTTFRPAYSNPLWSSDGTTLFFNHIPLDSVYEYPPGSGQILQAFNHDLEGFWSVDTSGQIMRRIYGQGLDGPVLSRDGTSVLYSAGGQIWRTAFAGDSLDPGSTTKMTNSTDGAFNPSLMGTPFRGQQTHSCRYTAPRRPLTRRYVKAPMRSRTRAPISTANPRVRVSVIWLPKRNPLRTRSGQLLPWPPVRRLVLG